MKKTNILLSVIIVIVLLVALPFIVPLFSAWSRINVTESEIDLLSGRVRRTVYLYWLNVEESYYDTPLSKELYGGLLNNSDGTWVKYGSSGIYVNHSPHYSYHSARFQAKQLGMIWAINETETSQRKKQASELLGLWRSNNSDDEGGDYISNIPLK
jgi:hypothetical protein